MAAPVAGSCKTSPPGKPPSSPAWNGHLTNLSASFVSVLSVPLLFNSARWPHRKVPPRRETWPTGRRSHALLPSHAGPQHTVVLKARSPHRACLIFLLHSPNQRRTGTVRVLAVETTALHTERLESCSSCLYCHSLFENYGCPWPFTACVSSDRSGPRRCWTKSRHSGPNLQCLNSE
jgi:hypothetical protein